MNDPDAQAILRKVTEADGKIRDASIAIATFAKSLVPTLRDAGREHSAKELERLLWDYDVAIQEAGDPDGHEAHSFAFAEAAAPSTSSATGGTP